MMKIYVLHGPNLNMLGKRDPKIYGVLTLDDLEAHIHAHAKQQGFEVQFFQTNHEGEYINWIHQLYGQSDIGVILNAGAWTHYSYAIRDAIEMLSCPTVEVHLSDVEKREAFRQKSVIRDVVDTHFQGEKEHSYYKAIDYIKGVHTCE